MMLLRLMLLRLWYPENDVMVLGKKQINVALSNT